MSVYLDASVLVSSFSDDSHSGRVDAYLARILPVLIVSDFAAAEFASAIGRRVRMGQIAADDAQSLFHNFDTWVTRETVRAQLLSEDIAHAQAILRGLDLPLRAPDALNIAITERLRADLATFDLKMAASARQLGLTVID